MQLLTFPHATYPADIPSPQSALTDMKEKDGSDFYWRFKKGMTPINKGKKMTEFGYVKPLSSKAHNLSDSEKEEFIKLCKTENITAVAKKFKMRIGLACKVQRELTPNEYLLSHKNKNRKLTKYQVIRILIEVMRDNAMQKDIAEKYGVAPCTISNICKDRHWKHVFQGAKKRYNKEILSIKSHP